MSHQYSRTEAQYDYCGEKLNRHNIKAHTDSKHKVLPVKERFNRQSTLCDFVTTGPKKAKLTEPDVTLEEEDDASAASYPVTILAAKWLAGPASYHIGCGCGCGCQNLKVAGHMCPACP